MENQLKLGTRKSLLAWAQSQQIANAVSKENTPLPISLYGIETEGDKIQDIPLSEIDGKEFFVKEIDSALKQKTVDLTVHSLKDLSLERPPEFHLAAIPKRKNARDVILFNKNVVDKLKNNQPITIGTSSPRRLENIPPFLDQALPKFNPSQSHKVNWISIRGNVNTRLKKIHLNLNHKDYLDGVVLAFAGLIRLYEDPKGKGVLSPLLKDSKWMVLPLIQCPTAPGQGALAVECRKNDEKTKTAIHKIHCKTTAHHILKERGTLQKYGGGCHQRFGATSIQLPHVGDLLLVQGKTESGNKLNEFKWDLPSPPDSPQVWDGAYWRKQTTSIQILDFNKKINPAVFVAHHRAVKKDMGFEKNRVWTSGVKSWYQLAKQGIWVEGCSEGFGFEFIKKTLEEKVLNLPSFDRWSVLTHQDAIHTWEHKDNVIATYKVQSHPGDQLYEQLKKATHVFWTSLSQFDAYFSYVNKDCFHSCRVGKTAEHLKANGIEKLLVFPSYEEWKKWIKI